jgi:hypothetical protein
MPRNTPITDPRLSWIPPLEDQPKRRSRKRKGAPWTASRSPAQPSDEPTEADVQRELELMWAAEADCERMLELEKRVKAWLKRVQVGVMRDELKTANRRMREEMANYRHPPHVAGPDGAEAAPPPP